MTNNYRSTALLSILVATIAMTSFGLQSAEAAIGDVLAQCTPAANTGNGRGVAFDGTDLYYTFSGGVDIYQVTTACGAVATITAPGGDPRIGIFQGGPLAFNPITGNIWTMDYSTSLDVLNIFSLYECPHS